MTHAFSPGRIASLALRNRFIKTATFEGMCPGGVPSPALTAHHRGIAAGGAAMTTVAYCSVSPDGRSYDTQMWMRPEILPALRELTDAVHEEGAAASIQLGHCGYFADSSVIGHAPLGPSRLFNTYGLDFCRAMSPEDIERVTGDFVGAARQAREAGFDAVEVHAGHGYLLSQFVSPFTNRRRDAHGGALENRARFPLDVVRRVREALGSDYPVLVKTNLRDGFDGGLELDEAVDVARALEQAGASALVPSGGFVSKAPLYMLRGDVPLRDMVSVQASLIRKIGLYTFGRLLVERFPYEPLFFLTEALRVREAVRIPVVLVGGITALEHVDRALDAGFDFVAMGRALIREPDLVRRYESGEATTARCIPCNKCIAEMDRGGVRCALDRPQP